MKKPFMKLNSSFFAAVAISSAFLLTACDTKDKIEEATTPTPTTPTTPSNPSPAFNDGSGTLSAVIVTSFQTVPIIGEIEVNFGVAVAAFYDDPSASTFLEAGTVMCNTNELTKQSNNAYAYTPPQTDADGIDFSSDEVTWEVSGAGTIPTFSNTNTDNFPDVENITSAETITKANGYTLSCGSTSFADSVLFLVGDVVHVHVGGTNSSTFTATELANLGAGATFVQIAAYNYTSHTENGKKFYLVKETVVNKNVTVQ